MKNSKVLFEDFIQQITLSESREELESMAYLVFEHSLFISRTDLMTNKPVAIEDAEIKLKEIARRISGHEPVQYILGEAEFFGRTFKVNPDVLIPRPETEELVREVLARIPEKHSPTFRLLDAGTGSGCIPISIKLERPFAEVMAIDVSEKALTVARENGTRLRAAVQFIHHDILASSFPFQNLDAVVSNPPYIGVSEKNNMSRNVLDFEPHLALFVNDDDPLIFYKAIAGHAFENLRHGGILAVEINERFGKEVAEVFSANGFQKINIIKDLSGKDRIVTGLK